MAKISYYSDLHLEFFEDYQKHYPNFNQNSDIIVLAGDISKGMNSMNIARDIAQKYGKKVVWIAGNHEFYGYDINQLSKSYELNVNLCINDGVYAIEYMDGVILDGLNFIGATLWTDCRLYNDCAGFKDFDHVLELMELGINDFNMIRDNARQFSALKSVYLHKKILERINYLINSTKSENNVLVTHHGVVSQSIAKKYTPSIEQYNSSNKFRFIEYPWIINPAFASNLESLCKKFDLCIHGHTHESINYVDENCKVVANPRGYPDRIIDKKYENSNFDENVLIEIGI